MRSFDAFRAAFPAYRDSVYLNHAATSPASESDRAVLEAWWSRAARPVEEQYQQWVEMRAALKADIARFIGAASADLITLTGNTTHGLNIAAAGLAWEPGDRVLLNRMEFPANIYPFLNLERLGVAVDWADPVDGRLPLEAWVGKVTARTRLVSVSLVQFLNGFTADLAALGAFCRDRGIWLVVDGIQGVGAIPFDLATTPVDALSCGGAKWMMWPQGTGFLYLSPALLEAVRPVHAGWLGVKDAWNFHDYRLEFLDTAERFEGGTLNWLGYSLAFERMKQFLRLGREAIWARVRRLADRLADGFQALGAEIVTPLAPRERSGIVTIRVPEPEQVLQRLTAAGIVLSLREGVLRFSPHVGNTEEDIDCALEALKAAL